MSNAPIPRWLPNAISVVRVLLVPAWAWCAELANRAAEGGGDAAAWRWRAAAVFATIGVSDVLDGWLARRFRLQSAFGAIIDAVADKLAQVVLTTYLALRVGPAFPAIPLWFLGLLIARDGLLLCGYVWIRARRGRVAVVHRWHGKFATVCLFAVLVAATFAAGDGVMRGLLIATAAIVVASTADYVRFGARQLAGRA